MSEKYVCSGISLWVSDTSVQAGNALKHFLGHLKHKNPRGRFSHADVNTTLHRELSLVENFLLAAEETMHDESYDTKEAYLSTRLETENLRVLASWFKNPRRKASELTEQERFMASVCYALLRPAEETFIDMSMIKLDPMCLSHLQQLIQIKSVGRHITVRLADKRSWDTDYDQELVMSESGLRKAA